MLTDEQLIELRKKKSGIEMRHYTLIYLSHRPGGIDLLADSLAAQESLTGVTWDLVVVDGWPGRVERGVAEEHLRSRGIPVRHYGVPLLKTFPWSRTGFANAMNTGLLYTTGSHVIFLHDYTWYHSKTIGFWHQALNERPDPDRVILCSAGIEYETPKPDADDDVVTWSGRSGDPRSWWIASNPWVPDAFDVGHWIAPMGFFEATNGIDPRADFSAVWARSCVLAQAKIYGCEVDLERRIICHMADHRGWVQREKEPNTEKDSLYRTYGHFADVSPIEPIWTSWSANPFNVSAVREHLRKQKESEETKEDVAHVLDGGGGADHPAATDGSVPFDVGVPLDP